jgi:hypothetical protein
MARPDLLLFRHVATVDGGGGRLAIVFDASTRDYAFIYPHRQNPRAGHRDRDLGEFRTSPFVTAHGSLDSMIALAQPVARGELAEMPTLSASPFATTLERELIGV